MSRAREGMRRDVQRTLGVVEDGDQPVIPCTCGGDRIIATDREIVGLVAIGRMIEYCARCNGVMRIYPGPPSLIREQKEATEYYIRTDKNGLQSRQPRTRSR